VSQPQHDESWEGWAESDRQQIASELHDGLLPMLFGARMHAERLAAKATDSQWRQELTMLVDEIAAAMNEGRRLLVDAHPPELEQSSWHDALAHYAEQGLPKATGVGKEGAKRSSRVDFDLNPATRYPVPRIARVAYRIAQEALRNAVRHGQADNVVVRASDVADGAFTLEIRDDGCGFDVDRIPADRFGIRSIGARAKLIGGTATITSVIGQGTTVTAQLPFEADPNS
jgi:signal transduction histidine kinase